MGSGKHGGKSFHGDLEVAALSLMFHFRDPEGSAWWRLIFMVLLVHIGARIAYRTFMKEEPRWDGSQGTIKYAALDLGAAN